MIISREYSQIDPVSVQDVRDWAKLEDDYHDAAIATYIPLVSRDFMQRTNTAIFGELVTVIFGERETGNSASWRQGEWLSLPIGPLVPANVSTVTVTHSSGTIDAANYDVLTGHRPRIRVSDALSINASASDELTISYTAGYGDTLDDIPRHIKSGIAAQCAHLVDGDSALDERRQSPSFQSLLNSSKRVSI